MDLRRSFGLLVVAGVVSLLLALPPSLEAQGRGQWQREAEETFWLGPGVGQRLMTREEWEEHRQKMQGMSSEERERYREERHGEMMERARERGITLPEMPGPHRGGQGTGMGPGGGRSRGGRY